MLGIFGQSPAAAGVTDGQLAACPSSPNCVSSQADDERHRVAPITYTVAKATARNSLLRLLERTRRVEIVRRHEDYIHAVFTSAVLRFKDDVEFYLGEPGTIHVRSASRLGYSDLGVNRKRVEWIRESLSSSLGSGR